MNTNTGIRIEAVREVSDTGEEGFRVMHVKALKRESLPELYLNGKREIVYERIGYRQSGLLLHHGDETMYRKSWNGILVNNFIPTAHMEKALAHIRAAGHHLTDVNAELKEKRENWQGKVIFVDGVETQNGKTKQQPFDKPIELAERIANLWEGGKLLYCDKKGHIKPLKPLK